MGIFYHDRSILPFLFSVLVLLLLSQQDSGWFCQAATSTSCYKDTRHVLLAQLQGMTQIEICAGTTLNIGFPTSNDFSTWSAMIPLMIVQDNVHVYCGPDQRSSNPCVIQGGATQLITLSQDHPLLVPLLAGLDTTNTTTSTTTTTTRTGSSTTHNLRVTGLTFQGRLVSSTSSTANDEDDENDFASFDGAGSSISIGVPGTNMVFDDCIFQNLSSSQTMFAIKRNNNNNNNNNNSTTTTMVMGPESAEVTFQNSIFRHLQFGSRVMENMEQVLQLENVSFTSITYQPQLQQANNDSSENDEDSFATIFQFLHGAKTFMINVTMQYMETLTTLIFQDGSPTILVIAVSNPVTIEHFTIHNQSSRSGEEYCAGGWLFEVEGIWICDDFVNRYAPLSPSSSSSSSSWSSNASSPKEDDQGLSFSNSNKKNNNNNDPPDTSTSTSSVETRIQYSKFLYALLVATIAIIGYP